MTISLRKARTIIRKTLEKGRELELKPLSVVVLDAGGHVQAFEREDGASPGRFAIGSWGDRRSPCPLARCCATRKVNSSGPLG